jgi:hypothetical protein
MVDNLLEINIKGKDSYVEFKWLEKYKWRVGRKSNK